MRLSHTKDSLTSLFKEVRVFKVAQQTGVYPYPLGAGSARPNPKKGLSRHRKSFMHRVYGARRGFKGSLEHSLRHSQAHPVLVFEWIRNTLYGHFGGDFGPELGPKLLTVMGAEASSSIFLWWPFCREHVVA